MSNFRGNRLFVYGLVVAIFFVCFISFYSTFSLENMDYKFESLVYDISDGYIENISVDTNLDLFMKYFDLDNCSIEVVDSTGKKIEDGLVYNGSETILYNKNKNVLATYINVIKGDFNADGKVNSDDFKKIGQCLVEDCSLDEYQVKSLDIDGDGEVHINDLLLLDRTITLGYTGISLIGEGMVLQTGEYGRIIASVKPNYGINQNVKWYSLDENIITIDDTGRIVGHDEGIAKIQAITLDGKFMAETSVVVDNTIQLESYEGTGYVSGNDLKVKIKAVGYEGITCSSSNIASCSIDGEYLIIHPLMQGSGEVVVTSSLYGEVKYKLDVYSVYLNVMPKYLCVTPGNVTFITVSSFHAGKLSFKPSDNGLITNAYMDDVYGRRMLRIEFGNKQGRVTLEVKESNANIINEVVVDVSRVSIPAIGSFTKVNQEISTSIAGDNLGILSCKSDDESVATCRIDGKKLIVNTFKTGEVYINVYNKFSYNDDIYNCGDAKFLVVVRE